MKDTGFCTFERNVTMQLLPFARRGEDERGIKHESGQMQDPEADISHD